MIVAAEAQIEAKKIFDQFEIGGKEAKDIFAWLLYVPEYFTGDEDSLNDIAQLAVMLESGQEVTFHTNEKGNIKLGKTSSDVLLNIICQEIIGFHPEKYDEDKSQEENDNKFISDRRKVIRSFLSESDTLKKNASIAKGKKSRYASMIGMLALELIERSETIQKRKPTEQRAFCYDCLLLVCPKVFDKESDPLTEYEKSEYIRMKINQYNRLSRGKQEGIKKAFFMDCFNPSEFLWIADLNNFWGSADR